MKNKTEDKNYFMGKETGYELINGVYHVAPRYQNIFERIMAQKTGVDALVQSVSKYAAETGAQIASEQSRTWVMLYDDLGLDKTKNWGYDYRDGTISEIKPEQKK